MALIHDFHFLRPLWLLALPALWALTVWLARRRGRDGNWGGLIDAELLPSLRLTASGKTRLGPWPWLSVAWTLAALALAGPAWQRDASAAWRSPAAWVLVLDLSPSMAATDLAPDRITRARYAIDDLLSAAHDGRVALVVFGDEPFTVTPLTEDVATVRAMLPPLIPAILPSAGDRLAPALEQAGQLLRRQGAQHGEVMVLSDGFADPAAAFSAARGLARQGARVQVVGIGTAAGAPLAAQGGGFALDAQGRPRLVRLDSGQLRQLALSGGGRYYDLPNLPNLTETLQNAAERTRDAQAAEGVTVARWRDAGVWLLTPLLLLVAFLGRRGWL
jgi:Ca-activated chloride channel homolog